ncbi:TetR/AcrR family transcriptional regulator [Dyadobacter sp. CY312]|uniref:TetR/AcrR family transcriptional regulator n=1 Tax=Dyadobacter sp. CY312 TaxID=2907303 RepID=UPI001F2A6B6C|nr:TetR/AcrR family transcriptional regulator [Dyadobacter sp. CY312]MCE7040114.1 TetR/AcrR family transcriptional regulator [Dyadobacter sp. CY312]
MRVKAKDEILRERILSGADKLFQKYGLAKTTMEDIAREAGKGKSTLYYYFKSKEEIVDAIIYDESDRLFAAIQSAVAEAPTAKDKMKALIVTRFNRLRNLTNLYNALVQEVREALAEQCVNEFSIRYRKQYDLKEAGIIKSILQYGIVTGEFRIFSEKELEMMSFIFMSSQRGLELDLIIHNKLDEILLRLNFLIEIMLSGIRK